MPISLILAVAITTGTGSRLYQTHLDKPGAPLVFAGRQYPDLKTFRLQVEILFKEQHQREASVTAARDLQQQLSQRLDALERLAFLVELDNRWR